MSLSSFFYLFVANFLGGAAAPVGAWTLETWHPAAVSFWRGLLTQMLFLPFMIQGLRRLSIIKEDWLRMAGVGVLGFGVPILIGSFGLKHSTATEAALLTCAEPVCIVMLSAVLLGEALSRRSVLSIACGVAGAVLIILQGVPGLGEFKATHWRGDLLLFTQGFFWALYTIIGKPTLKRVDPMTFTALTSALALPVLAAAAFFAPRHMGAAAPLLFGAVFAFVGPLVWNYAMEVVSATQLANFVFLQPLVGVALGVLLRHDAFTVWSAAGGGLILTGVYAAAKA
ncbi:MAG: DMT family transporter [Elusimicrobia bacterium]|nr:DMT family transporter [Elusimicrobiota bacterium]